MWLRRQGSNLRRRTYGNSQVITASQLGNLTNTSERSAHHNSLVPKLLVVIEDALDGRNSWVFLLGVRLSGLGLVPIQDAANERRDEEHACLGGGDGLHLGEEEGKVAVDAVLFLQDARGLDALPGGGDLDQDARLVNSEVLVQLFQLALSNSFQVWNPTYINNVQSLVDTLLGIERETSINLS